MRPYGPPAPAVMTSATGTNESAAVLKRSGPTPMAFHEKQQARAAAQAAKRLYPGPIGEHLADDLLAHAEFGYRVQADSRIARLVRHLMTATA